VNKGEISGEYTRFNLLIIMTQYELIFEESFDPKKNNCAFLGGFYG
jgi:hypothetical protein